MRADIFVEGHLWPLHGRTFDISDIVPCVDICTLQPRHIASRQEFSRFGVASLFVRLCRVAKWISASFGGEEGIQQGSDGVYAHFISLRTGLPLTISMQAAEVMCACCWSNLA